MNRPDKEEFMKFFEPLLNGPVGPVAISDAAYNAYSYMVLHYDNESNHMVLPDNESFVGITCSKDKVLVASTKHIYQLQDGLLIKMHL